MRKFFFKTITITLVFAVCFAFFAGCVKSPFKDSEDAIARDQKMMKRIDARDGAPIPAVLTKSNYYSDTNKIDERTNPRWLRQHISVESHGLPFSFVISHILRNNRDVLVKYNPRVSQDRLINLSYNGTIKGALDQLASYTNYAYDIDCNELIWEAFVSKTFNISFMPGAATYTVGQTSSQSSNTNSSTASSAGINVTTTTGAFMNADQQFSGMQASSLSVWEDLRKTLDQLKSPDGKISVSEATTMVTVYDRPSNVEAIGRYIDQLNKSLSQQVRLKVQVLEVDLDQAHLYGIDWNLVQHWFGTQVAIAGNLGSTANVAGAVGSQAITSFLTPASIQIGKTGNDVLLQALSTQGKLSVVTEPTVVTMNNQVAEIRINRDTSYLQSSSVSTLQNGPTTTQLNPGVVTEGFILYLLPKIKDGKVYLEVSSTLSNLVALNTIFSNGLSQNQQTSTNTQSIQVPTIDEKKFNIRSVVPNNNTLVIGGFKQTNNSVRSSKMFGLQILGGKGSSEKNVETILLITPTISETEVW